MSNDDLETTEDTSTSPFGLGSGLDALFSEEEPASAPEAAASEEPAPEETTPEQNTADSEAFNIADSQPDEDDMESDIDALIAQEEAQSPVETQPIEEPEEAAIEAEADAKAEEENQITDTPAPKPSSAEKGRARQVIPIENLYPSPFQPRKIFRAESLEQLASSIRQYGVLQPLLVRKDPANDDGYEIIAGERRWRASQQAQLHELPVIVLDIGELEAYKIALIENLQREDIDPIDEAYGYKKLLEDFGQTQEELADAVGKSRPHITNTLRLLQLPSVTQGMLIEKQITMGHARALIGIDNADEIANKVVKQGLSVRQTEKLAAGAKGKPQQKRPRDNSEQAIATAAPQNKDADTRALENDISNALGMNVTIDSSDGKSGKLSVEFKSLDQLDEVLHRLAHFPGSRLNG